MKSNRANVESAPKLDTQAGVAIAMLLRSVGFPIHRIGALFDANQGRVSEAVGERRKLKVQQ